jgi:WD40 repeat protein
MRGQQTDGKPSRARRGTRWAVALVAACAALVVAGRLSRAGDAKPAGPRNDATGKARTDLYGDKLPPGALARLGTLRWRHGAAVSYVAFTPDGKAVLTASQDDVIRLWDRHTGKEIRRFARKPLAKPDDGKDPAAQLRRALAEAVGAWGPFGSGGGRVTLAPDGKTLAATTLDGTIQLWEVATGKQVREIQAPPAGAGTLLFSPNGKLLAGRGADQTAHLWETSTGKEIRLIRGKQGNRPGFIAVGGAYGAPGVAFSPDSKTLAIPETVFANQKVTTSVNLCDVDTGKEVRRIEVNQQAGASAVAFSPDGKLLAYGSGNAVHLCAPDTGKEIRRIEGQQGMVMTLVFSPDGKTLATKSMGDPRIRLYSTETGKALRELGEEAAAPGINGLFVLGLGGGAGRDVAFSPDGKVVAAGGDNTVRFWAADTGKEIAQVSGHRGEVTALVVAAGGKLVGSRGADNTIRLWEADTGKERHQFRAPAGTTCVAFAPDARTVALGLSDSTVRLHETASGKELRRLEGHRNGVAAVAFSPDGKTVASRGSLDNTIRIYEAGTGKEIRAITITTAKDPGMPGGVIVINPVGFGGPSVGLAFSPDGKTVASAGTGAAGGAWAGPGPAAVRITLTCWDVSTGKVVHQIVLPQQSGVTSFAFAPDGRTLATENTDGTLTLWEIASGQERARFGKPPAMGQPVVGGMRVMFAGGFGGFGMTGASPTVAFAPDGRVLVSRGPDPTVRVWDVATAKEIGQLEGHDGNVTALAFAPDGKTLVSGGKDSTVLVWDATRLKPLPRPKPAALKAGDLDALWTDLAGADAVKAYRGIQTLTTSPAQVVPFLGERLRPAVPVDAAKLRQLVADLEGKRFAVRQRATNELEKLGELAVPALKQALAAEPPLETRKRVEQLLEKLTGPVLSNDQLRLVRALEVLEEIGSAEARRVLERLSKGAPGALPTREAQAALERLAGRSPAGP